MTRRSFWQRLIGGAVAAVAVRETMPTLAPVLHPEAPIACREAPLAFHPDAFKMVMRDLPLPTRYDVLYGVGTIKTEHSDA